MKGLVGNIPNQKWEKGGKVRCMKGLVYEYDKTKVAKKWAKFKPAWDNGDVASIVIMDDITDKLMFKRDRE